MAKQKQTPDVDAILNMRFLACYAWKEAPAYTWKELSENKKEYRYSEAINDLDKALVEGIAVWKEALDTQVKEIVETKLDNMANFRKQVLSALLYWTNGKAGKDEALDEVVNEKGDIAPRMMSEGLAKHMKEILKSLKKTGWTSLFEAVGMATVLEATAIYGDTKRSLEAVNDMVSLAVKAYWKE